MGRGTTSPPRRRAPGEGPVSSGRPRSRLANRLLRIPAERGAGARESAGEELRREVAEHLDQRAKIEGFPGRVLVLHAVGDTMIHRSSAERLASWARRAELRLFERGDHNTILAENLPAIVEAVRRLVGASPR